MEKKRLRMHFGLEFGLFPEGLQCHIGVM